MNPSLFDWLQRNWIALVALAISVSSLALSAFNTNLNWREKRRRLRVRLSWASMRDSPSKRVGDPHLEVSVKNKGCALQITSVVYAVLGVGRYQISHPKAELKPREFHTFTERPDNLASAIRYAAKIQGVVKLAAVVTEAGGKEWTSNAVTFDIDKLVKQHDDRSDAEAKLTAELEGRLNEERLDEMFPWRKDRSAT